MPFFGRRRQDGSQGIPQGALVGATPNVPMVDFWIQPLNTDEHYGILAVDFHKKLSFASMEEMAAYRAFLQTQIPGIQLRLGTHRVSIYWEGSPPTKRAEQILQWIITQLCQRLEVTNPQFYRLTVSEALTYRSHYNLEENLWYN